MTNSTFIYRVRWKFNGFGDVVYDYESWVDPSAIDQEMERLKKLNVPFTVQRYALDESFQTVQHHPKKKKK